MPIRNLDTGSVANPNTESSSREDFYVKNQLSYQPTSQSGAAVENSDLSAVNSSW